MNALIIEDEYIAAESLKLLLSEHDKEIKVLHVLQSIDESIEWFNVHSMPDLVFMDIHLADGSSFSIFDGVQITCPIIFTTAYDEYALPAFEVNSIDYLLKPINKKELERALAKYHRLAGNPATEGDQLSGLLRTLKENSRNYKSHFLVPEKDKLIPLAVKDIAFICIDSRMVKAISHEGRIYYFDQTLDELMKQLDPIVFFRANRQYIISHNAIKDISLWFGNKLSVNLKTSTPERVVISKARVPEFKKWFAG